jgi:predicted nucleic acid-binding protein
MAEQPSRIYADTSVYGGVFDAEFARASRKFFDQAEAGRFRLIVSEVVEREVAGAPRKVRDLFQSMLPHAEFVRVSEAALDLRDAYIAEGIVTRKALTDALHVALTSVCLCSVLASWNCTHIVHYQKIPLYNAVNTLRGFPQIAIHTPMEVIGDGD